MLERFIQILHELFAGLRDLHRKYALEIYTNNCVVSVDASNIYVNICDNSL